MEEEERKHRPKSWTKPFSYLTIKSYDAASQTYEMGYPNKEVKSSLPDALLSAYREIFPADSIAVTGNLKTALLVANIPKIIEALNAIISTIHYEHWKADTESIFRIITHLTFKKIGIDISSEVHCQIMFMANTITYHTKIVMLNLYILILNIREVSL